MKKHLPHFSFLKLVYNNLLFYKTSNLWIFAAVAIATMVTAGALYVGDSVKFTLKKRAIEGLGWVSSAIYQHDRWFTTNLASEFRFNLETETALKPESIRISTAIKLDGSVTKPDESARANRVNVYGVDENFWDDSFRNVFKSMPPKHAILNETLADQLKLLPGDEFILRVKKPATLSLELPISLQENAYIGLRLRVHSIVSGKDMGNFSLQSSQLTPLNLFIHYHEIASAVDKTGAANLLLCNLDKSRFHPNYFEYLLTRSITPADCGIEVHMPIPGIAELRSKRVFIERFIVEKAFELIKSNRWQDVFETNAVEILAYLANLFSRDGRQTPYSIIVAAGEPFVESTIPDDGIVINRWLAEDLEAKVGDSIRVQYYLPESDGKLTEVTNLFRVAGVVEHNLPWFDKTLLPDIPGLAKAESTQDWNLGFPLVHKFRKKDDDYWRDYRGTPKAFIKLSTGKKLWANRFGEATAVRFKIKDQNITSETLSRFAYNLIKECGSAAFGFVFLPVRDNLVNSAEKSQDFGGLFLGFSFFLIISALSLVALLFSLNLERRYREFGTYFAVGFTGAEISKLLFCETIFMILLGTLTGAMLGAGYSKLMLHFLSTIWKDATGGVELEFHMRPSSFLTGVLSAVFCSLFVIFLTIKRLKKMTIRRIFSQSYPERMDVSEKPAKNIFKIIKSAIPLILIVAGILNAFYLIFTGNYTSAGGFFLSGMLILAGGILFLPTVLRSFSVTHFSQPNLTLLSLRSASRNIKRTVLTAGMFASGFFILISVSVFRLASDTGSKFPSSGTGGFDLIAETTIPIFKDLNTEEGLSYYGLNKTDLGDVFFVPFRVKEGDEASCLNLNRAIKPRLIACDWRLLTNRFSFSMYDRNPEPESNWELLGRVITNKTDGGEELIIPAIGDAASIQWAMGKKLGDTIDYTDEFGRNFKIKIVAGLANSIMQGNLIINEEIFRRLFPGVSGYQFFLIDCKNANIEDVSIILSRAFSDYGMEIIKSSRRLAQFNAVQNTYIGAFQILGGLGFLLGCIGIAIILIRNVLERRNELAVMVAVGFSEKTVRNMVILEHTFVIFAGFILGIVPAAISIAPSIFGKASQFSFTFPLLLIIGSGIMGVLWTNLASNLAFKTRLIDALRIE